MRCGFKLPRIAILHRRQVAFQINDFAHVRRAGCIASQNNTRCSSLEGCGLIRSM
jgi:hypothetical protein